MLSIMKLLVHLHTPFFFFLQTNTVQRVLNSSVMTRPIAAFAAHRLSQTSRLYLVKLSHRWPAPRIFPGASLAAR